MRGITNEMVGYVQLEKRMKTHAAPYCHKCGGKLIRVTSSQQMLKVRGKKMLHAEAFCPADECHNTWWSRHPVILRMAREADKKRNAR